MTFANPIDTRADGFTLSDQDFESIADFAHKHFGLAMSSSKKPLVSSRLARRLRKLNYTDFKSYLQELNGPNADAERSELLSLLTTNVTQFFREPHHFDTLRDDVLPPLLEKARRGDRVRIWSAGCSNGQEPYTIAMVLKELCPDVERLDVKILGTDIDPVVVRKASAARYSADELSQIPQKYSGYYKIEGQDGAIRDDLRGLLTFGVLNLIEPFPFKGKFDAIFCRNVAIYFDTPTQQKVWHAFQRSLNPGGYLFIGHSERMSGPAASALQTVGITTYLNSPAGRNT
ncbi:MULTISPECIES: protein-glutamate O-methyltransferase CheR [Phaeobacter]|uniref:Chemotaxis protein methyltransferase n=1 Tax=Phaeobacter piscinae TaxID=1580596 RepID=A0ABN5DK53_9RHOB|nr:MULTISPECIES: protein-glutamate O-methyltransferase [Phaeobacter]ATG37726.1 methyltransferase, cheR type [Phaeobacter piscinae]ATG41665.1 methyltransferase, cheR type [Phaeobacter piscinae]AUQ88247.1 methyltransferase, cheR type [Phaeobacter piscinae]AUR26130.1 methyltransferase, cheR type [Phaeobacter piscinae]KII15614.1 chemotaxis protein [Phaeobacter sp. S60]